jgi:hypothetical protein
LQLAVDASALDPVALTNALRAGGASEWRALREEILVEPAAEWERDLVEALDYPESSRVALVNEQLSELDYRAERWARAPRVCASVSTTFGFLLAFAMVASMATSEMDVGAAVVSAINVVAVGLAGAAFCIAAHLRAAAIVRGRLAATDELLARLERLEKLPPERLE